MIRLGLIGCAGMGTVHRRAMERLKGRAEVTAAVDIDEKAAHDAAEQLGCQRVATDFREALDDMDAAVLALPHHVHHPIGMEVLSAGKHVLMEKPLANSEEDCLDLIRAAKRCKVQLMVGYCMRYNPLALEMERLLSEKAFGDMFQLSLWTEQRTQGPAGSWKHKAATLGGGQLFSHGCHYIDILLAWMGRPVEGTHMGTNTGTPWMEREGTSHVTIKFENGALGYHFGTWGAMGTRLKYSFHAHCTEAMLEMQFSKGRLIVHRDAAEEAEGREKVIFEADKGKHIENELVHFVESLESGNKPRTDAARSLQSLRVIWRLYEAEERGMVADLRGLGLDQVAEDGSLVG